MADKPGNGIALALMAASGFAGLGYQIVWTQQAALWLGHDAPAVLAVVAAFFGGLACGALAFGPAIERSRHPRRWYVACELAIALWSLVLCLAMAPISEALTQFIGVQPSPLRQWTITFLGLWLLLLPATAAMGATLPAMERMTTELGRNLRSLAALYASNTMGAVIGVLATAFWLVPVLGLAATAGVCIGLNLFCAAMGRAAFAGSASIVPARTLTPATSNARGLLLRLTCTGLLGIGFEVLVVRVLSQVAEDTVYTFAMLLAIYLVGTALGAAAGKRWLERRSDRALSDRGLQDRLLGALALACLFGTASLWAAEAIKRFVLATFGQTMIAALAAEAVLALVAFGPATFVMGALFCELSGRAAAAGLGFGRALGVNTLGAAAAPLLFGVFAFSIVGPKAALLLVCLGYLLLIPLTCWRRPSLWLPASLTLATAVLAPALAFIDIPDGGRVLSYREGVMAAVSVVEDADGIARLRINNRQQEGTSATRRVDGRQAMLPLLLHPAPKRALFLGLGTGTTASVAAEDAGIQVDAVELLPEVIEASRLFIEARADSGKAPANLQRLPADARRYVRTATQQYDVIVADNFHPARSGSGSLYTVEHFEAVRGRLADGGLFCQWLPLHQLDLETLRSIVQSFLIAYPDATAILANNSLETPVVGLIGFTGNARRFDSAAVQTRVQQAVLAKRYGIDDEFALLGSFVSGTAALQRFAGNADANTDDHPVVSYRAPRITYAPDSLPRDRLITLLQALSVSPSEILASGDAEATRLAAYWQARNQFIQSGRDVRPASRVQDMLAQVQQPLLSILRISPDFRPAYDPLLFMATRLAATDRTGAQALLQTLSALQPERPEALQALHEMETSEP